MGYANAVAAATRLQRSFGTIALVILVGCSPAEEAGSGAPPAQTGSVTLASAPTDDPQVRASRLFAGADQYPPEDFAAYGILAFRSEATSQSEPRYLAICEGFLAGLPAATVLSNRGVPLAQQMATVWPLVDSVLANDLNGTNTESARFERCRDVVAGIDLITSRTAIANAMQASGDASLAGEGPYLIAWSPSTTFGQPDVPVLVWDLSDVTNIQEAKDQFVAWADEIVRNPDLWRGGWDLERVRTVLRMWADKYGPGLLHLLGLRDV